jgi:hypothetical protein
MPIVKQAFQQTTILILAWELSYNKQGNVSQHELTVNMLREMH